MSYSTWHTYGYGVKLDNIKFDSVEKLQDLIALAPKYEAQLKAWLQEDKIDEPTVEDYYAIAEMDTHYKLATILENVILEVDHILFTACDDFDGGLYLLYEPRYPWDCKKKNKKMTQKKIQKCLKKASWGINGCYYRV